MHKNINLHSFSKSFLSLVLIVGTACGAMIYLFLLLLIGCDVLDSPNKDSWEFTIVDDGGVERGADGVFLKVIDGIYYVVTPWQDSDAIRLCEGDPDNNWDCRTIGFHESSEYAFFNGLDVVSCGKEGIKFHYFPDWMTFTIPSPEQEWNDALIVDVNKDGLKDIVAGGDKGILGWFKAPFWEFEHFVSPDEMGVEMGLHGEDMDGDGDIDFIVSDRGKHSEAGVSWFENPSWERHQIVLRKELRMFDISDVNGDGLKDVIVGARSPSEVIIAYAPRWEVEVIPANFGGFPKDVAVGDIDLDEFLDIVVTTVKGEGEYYLAGPDWEFRPIHTLGKKDDNIILYDFDLDGDLDLLTTIEIPDVGVVIFWNKANQ